MSARVEVSLPCDDVDWDASTPASAFGNILDRTWMDMSCVRDVFLDAKQGDKQGAVFDSELCDIRQLDGIDDQITSCTSNVRARG
jgi:hypothetical protein